MSRWTPGPWRVVSWGDRFSVAETQDNDRHPVICDVSGPNCWPNAKANAMAIAAVPDLIAALLPIAAAYPDDPGTSDLYDDQPVTITLGDVRRAWKVLAKLEE